MSTRSIFRFDRDRPPRWLNWVNGHIVNVIGGGATIDLDGSTTTSRVHWAFPFDRALTLDDGSYQFIYAVAGTKGVVVADASKFVREMNRSFYCANAYEYPVRWDASPTDRRSLCTAPRTTTDWSSSVSIPARSSPPRRATPSTCSIRGCRSVPTEGTR